MFWLMLTSRTGAFLGRFQIVGRSVSELRLLVCVSRSAAPGTVLPPPVHQPVTHCSRKGASAARFRVSSHLGSHFHTSKLALIDLDRSIKKILLDRAIIDRSESAKFQDRRLINRFSFLIEGSMYDFFFLRLCWFYRENVECQNAAGWFSNGH
jgi:hypothetical protein